MGQINDLKKKMYGGFLQWLDANKMGDCFDNDIWGLRIFDRLYKSYEKSVDISNSINTIPIPKLEKFIQDRKENIEKKNKIIQPKKDIKVVK